MPAERNQQRKVMLPPSPPESMTSESYRSTSSTPASIPSSSNTRGPEATRETPHTTEAHQPMPCGCSGTCDCAPPLVFPQRVCDLPPVKTLAAMYCNLRESTSALGCVLLTGEAAGLLASAPAVALSRPLRRAFETPIFVADLVLCKGLDLAERAFPCITATPSQVCKAVALCACGVPAGASYLSAKLACKALRTCVCDLPALACGLPSLLGCSALEICLCDAPAALCGIPGKITAKAAHTALKDARSVCSALQYCSEQVFGQFTLTDR